MFFVFFVPCCPTSMRSMRSGPPTTSICVVRAQIHSTAEWRLWLLEVNSKVSPQRFVSVPALPNHAALLALYQFDLCFVRSLCQVIVLQYGKNRRVSHHVLQCHHCNRRSFKKKMSICILVNDFAVSLLRSQYCPFTENNSLKEMFLSKQISPSYFFLLRPWYGWSLDWQWLIHFFILNRSQWSP